MSVGEQKHWISDGVGDSCDTYVSLVCRDSKFSFGEAKDPQGSTFSAYSMSRVCARRRMPLSVGICSITTGVYQLGWRKNRAVKVYCLVNITMILDTLTLTLNW